MPWATKYVKLTKELSERLGVGLGVANELMVLSGGDIDLAERCSKESAGLDQCKAAIIDGRFKRLEDPLFNPMTGKPFEFKKLAERLEDNDAV